MSRSGSREDRIQVLSALETWIGSWEQPSICLSMNQVDVIVSVGLFRCLVRRCAESDVVPLPSRHNMLLPSAFREASASIICVDSNSHICMDRDSDTWCMYVENLTTSRHTILY